MIKETKPNQLTEERPQNKKFPDRIVSNFEQKKKVHNLSLCMHVINSSCIDFVCFNDTTMCVFSATQFVKTKLCSRISDKFLTSFLITYNERDTIQGFHDDSIIDAFDNIKQRQLKCLILVGRL